MLEQSRQYRAMVEARAKLSAQEMASFLERYGPYAGAGIRVVEASPDSRRWVVEMPLLPTNQNYMGTHFGGSLYAMCDPFFVLILIRNLGPDFLVWDTAASIRFRRPGTGTVRATFELSEAEIEVIRGRVARERRVELELEAVVLDERGEVVAEVKKTLYVRRNPVRSASSGDPLD